MSGWLKYLLIGWILAEVYLKWWPSSVRWMRWFMYGLFVLVWPALLVFIVWAGLRLGGSNG